MAKILQADLLHINLTEFEKPLKQHLDCHVRTKALMMTLAGTTEVTMVNTQFDKLLKQA